MNRLSSFILLVCSLLAVIERSHAAPDNLAQNTAAAADIVPATGDVTAAITNGAFKQIDGTTNVKAGVILNSWFVTKTGTKESNLKFNNCALVTTGLDASVIATPDSCKCDSAQTTAATPADLTSAAVSTVTPAVAAAQTAANFKPIYIYKTFCVLQGAQCVSAAANPCVAAATAPAVAGGTNTTVNGTVVAGSPGAATPAPGVGGSSTVKGGASMTTPKMAALTIAPLAMLAIANFVV